MGSWLYPISSRGEYWYELSPGRKVPMSFEVFRDSVLRGKTSEKWVVNQNFGAIRLGDELFIYTGDRDRGIIGYAKVTGKDERTQCVIFRLDRQRTKDLLFDPIPAPLIRPHIPPPRKTVVNLGPHMSALRKLLPWSVTRARQEALALSPLNLRPRRRVAANLKARKDARWLLHDTVLQPVDDFLSVRRFEVGGHPFGRLRVDMAARRGRDLVIVEGKTIKKGSSGREEARTGLGQLLEYSWWFKHHYHHLRHHLWVAFSARPGKTIVDFLEDHKVFVSWTKSQRSFLSEKSKSEWNRRFKSHPI